MPAKTDANQGEIVRVLRRAGCTVTSLHEVGKGCPDLLVGRIGLSWCLEVKMPRGPKTPEPAPLTPAQIVWHQQWRGHVAVVTTPEEALRAVGVLKETT